MVTERDRGAADDQGRSPTEQAQEIRAAPATPGVRAPVQPRARQAGARTALVPVLVAIALALLPLMLTPTCRNWS